MSVETCLPCSSSFHDYLNLLFPSPAPTAAPTSASLSTYISKIRSSTVENISHPSSFFSQPGPPRKTRSLSPSQPSPLQSASLLATPSGNFLPYLPCPSSFPALFLSPVPKFSSPALFHNPLPHLSSPSPHHHRLTNSPHIPTTWTGSQTTSFLLLVPSPPLLLVPPEKRAPWRPQTLSRRRL